MSAASVLTFRAMKAEGRKIVFLTAYDWMLARYLAAAGVDGILVGDSVGQVFAGHPTTIPVTARPPTPTTTRAPIAGGGVSSGTV